MHEFIDISNNFYFITEKKELMKCENFLWDKFLSIWKYDIHLGIEAKWKYFTKLQ